MSDRSQPDHSRGQEIYESTTGDSRVRLGTYDPNTA